MPTLVVASEEEEGGRVVDLQGPQKEHTLQMQTENACHKNTTHNSNAIIYPYSVSHNTADTSVFLCVCIPFPRAQIMKIQVTETSKPIFLSVVRVVFEALN